MAVPLEKDCRRNPGAQFRLLKQWQHRASHAVVGLRPAERVQQCCRCGGVEQRHAHHRLGGGDGSSHPATECRIVRHGRLLALQRAAFQPGFERDRISGGEVDELGGHAPIRFETGEHLGVGEKGFHRGFRQLRVDAIGMGYQAGMDGENGVLSDHTFTARSCRRGGDGGGEACDAGKVPDTHPRTNGRDEELANG